MSTGDALVHKTSLSLALVSCLVACDGTAFHVYVRDMQRKPIAQANVQLLELSDQTLPSAAALSTPRGIASLPTHGCGTARLQVSAAGYESITRKLDSCGSEPVTVFMRRSSDIVTASAEPGPTL